MGLLITTDDFVGRWELTTNEFTVPKLNSYIDLYEEKYLKELMGVELFTDFKDDVTNHVPVSAWFLAIYNPINSDENKGCPIVSLGLKAMVLGIIYYLYQRDEFLPTITGLQKGKSETARNASIDEANVYGRWNEAVDSGLAITNYILDNLTTYPNYNGPGAEGWCGCAESPNYVDWSL